MASGRAINNWQARRNEVGKKNYKNLSIIDRELQIEGSVSSTGKLIIKGHVIGTIKGDVVIIAEDGRVNSSDTKVSSITIAGNFQGDLTASKELIVLSTGICAGKVRCKDLIVENGGILNAEVSCKTTNSLSEIKDQPVFGHGKLKEVEA
ncbi:MAG: polymer-forming cytoskeletal protein [Desulfobacula sp.]|jgi:cytoskeletal protein CcmA (bactofilin family)|nr:polymer-forming cytoskeletal protein [Desulfobacula sp.]MBT3485180.1 polymer-forming cytoskeletal protein [Desulfobacula sp.]MBT3804075.1 polymer-forming cytoskeletal protein [Desulfobacula sp.]MBT4025384.1 polymer-forming cytoskeletal protein [Desulfobacula sp.]MBT4199464.1 polymer-forming cytoskeletal protein [Desulfobacula sp.]